MSRSSTIVSAALLVLLLCPCPSTARAGEETDTYVALEVTLVNALVQRHRNRHDPASLQLYMRRVEGRWQNVIGLARNFNANFHCGFVRRAVIGAAKMEFGVAMEMKDDLWVPGGWGWYTIELTKGEDFPRLYAERPVPAADPAPSPISCAIHYRSDHGAFCRCPGKGKKKAAYADAVRFLPHYDGRRPSGE